MYIKDFEFDGKSVLSEGFFIGTLDDEENLSLGADITVNYTRSTGTNISYFHGSTYEENISFHLQIFKFNPVTDLAEEIDDFALSKYMRWFTKDNRYCELILTTENGHKLFTKAQINANRIEIAGRTCGFDLNINTYSPILFKEEYVHTEDITEESFYFNIKDSSDKEGYQMLDVVVQCKTDGDLEITNLFDNRTTRIKNCKKNEFINIDSKNQILVSSLSSHKIYDDFNYVFPKIHNTKFNNLNTFVVNVPCNITLKYSPIALIGGVV